MTTRILRFTLLFILDEFNVEQFGACLQRSIFASQFFIFANANKLQIVHFDADTM